MRRSCSRVLFAQATRSYCQTESIVPGSPAAQLNAMIARFEPAIQRVVQQARTKLRKRLPAALELVYDNYNALAIGYGSSEEKSDAVLYRAVSLLPGWLVFV